ncbi:MAG TPA: FtsX-like permease family protein [Gammaproteobacteria bacterium]|nr:FtsX-like permease family protein [Gammaproteobacteria bacterium]
MTKFLPLVWASLWRKPTRTILTTFSLVAAFLLFGVLDPIAQVFEGSTGNAVANRLVVSPRHSTSDMLPVRYSATVLSIEGVENVTHQTWFGGMFRDPANNFMRFAVSARSWLDTYPEILLPEDQRRAFIDTPTGAIVGRATADKYGLHVGDKLPLIADIWHNRDGSHWTFDLTGIFDGADESVDTTRMLINYDYFDEYRVVGPGYVSNLIVTLEPDAEPAQFARTIDETFANSSMETRTVSGQEFLLRMVRQYGDVGLIVRGILAAVFFTIVLLAANTMAQATRERTIEIAVMKTVGFPARRILALVLSESIVIPLAAALGGLAMARIVITYAQGMLTSFVALRIDVQTIVTSLALAVAIGIVAGWPPARRAARLDVATALQER